MSYRICLRLVVVAIAWGIVFSASAQTCGFLGQRTIKGFWIENGLGLVVTPTQNFDNAAACTKTVQAIVLQSHPLYKQMHASVMMAMATGTPINAYGCGCQAAWNNDTYPLIVNFGVAVTPQ